MQMEKHKNVLVAMPASNVYHFEKDKQKNYCSVWVFFLLSL